APAAGSRGACAGAGRPSRWDPTIPPPPTWPELAGKTLGILGYGRIGQALARRARAFHIDVWAIRRHPAGSDRGGLVFLGGPDALDEILRRSDYLAITLALTEATRGWLGERELRRLQPPPVPIHAARAD